MGTPEKRHLIRGTPAPHTSLLRTVPNDLTMDKLLKVGSIGGHNVGDYYKAD